MPLTPLGTMKLQTTNEILLWVKTRSHRNFVPPSVFVPTNLSVYKFPFPCQGYFLLNQHVLEERIGRVGKVMDRSIVGQSDRIVYGSWKLNQFPFVRYLVPLHLETHDFVLHPGRRNETPAPTMRLAVVNDVHKLSMYCNGFVIVQHMLAVSLSVETENQQGALTSLTRNEQITSNQRIVWLLVG